MDIFGFINRNKYKILFVLVLILLWRIFSENLFLIVLILGIFLFYYPEYIEKQKTQNK